MVPFKVLDAKSRLGTILGSRERETLARYMLSDMLTALGVLHCPVTVLATEQPGFPLPRRVELKVDNRELSTAVNDFLEEADCQVLITMADLPLVRGRHLKELCAISADLVIAPGRRGGSNIMLVRRPQEFRVDYYGSSYLDHLRIAEDAGLSTAVYESFRCFVDIDHEDDLLELYLHGDDSQRAYLRGLGLSLQEDNGAVKLLRKE